MGINAGITGGFGGDRRVEYIIPAEARKKGTHSFVAEASCNGMFGVPWSGDIIQPPDVCLSPLLTSPQVSYFVSRTIDTFK